MKWSQTFIPTMKEAPKEAEVPSHKLMLRAGLIQNLSSGLYIYLPLGRKVIEKVMKVIRAKLEEYGAIELSMPALQPRAIWEKTGRWDLMADLMLRCTDREDREFVLGPTHEEIITDLVAKRISSYRQVPLNFFQIQTKFRDEIRPRFGVIRAKEFIMKDGYSFDLSVEDAFKAYDKMYEAYKKIFTACGIKLGIVEADTGVMGDGGKSHEFMAISEIGEDVIVTCEACGYAANSELAIRSVVTDSSGLSVEKPLELVDTPDVKSVEEVSAFFKTKSSELIKTLIYKAEKDFIFILIRGDAEVNEIKLKKYLKIQNLQLAEETDIERLTKAPVGFAGPVGISNVRIIADLSVNTVECGITGANIKDKHYKNVKPGRDFKITEVADIGKATEGDVCGKCGKKLSFARGIEVGQVFFLGTKYSSKLDAKVIDQNGKETTLVMGCYGIGVSRTVAAVIECNSDKDGIVWPLEVAPFEVLIIPLDVKNEQVNNLSKSIYEDLKSKNIDVLIDDRDERPGFKFKDADLIGIPLRITIGQKSLEKNQVEISLRKDKQVNNIDIKDVNSYVSELLKNMKKQ
ncbi:MAG: hypothetical protein ACD_79C00373G0002 [uncultured bacterium]|nr:MAG: hypothetical protein ACD_79C00373G0002 [uncultured bacterium]